MIWRIADPAHLLAAVRVALVQGGEFLCGRLAPNGPILEERNVSYVHKASWGMYAAGVDHAVIARLLDWAEREALRENGDFYFPEETVEYKDFQRAYRPLNFLKVAAWIDHPIVQHPGVIERILQYQHEPSGGVFHLIGDDPGRIEPPQTIGVLNTTFFGHLMIALDMRDRAAAAGDWVRQWVEVNREHIATGCIYTQMTPEGKLVTEVKPGERIGKVVDTQRPKQEFWHLGTAMAYLAVLYDTMRGDWGHGEEDAKAYLDAALALLKFEATMPLDTYLWPSKCKVGWGAGELLRVLVKYRPEDEETIEKAYCVAERVAMFTFLDNQLPDGGWPWMHYPLSETIPEMAFSYKPLKHTVRVPPQRIAGSQTIFLPREEITGEFLGEIKAIEQGVAAWLHAPGRTSP
ncbi:MAG TPA: hypothetical protein VMY42_28290 [Thermoguttaceae bacterium]|nr:hypothetical protein [Thermoguttaceae bacterium]